MAKEKNISDVLKQIVEGYGEDIFLDQRRVYAILCDLASGDMLSKQRRRIKMSLESGCAEILLKAKKDQKAEQLYINESVNRLISNTDMDESVARETVTILADALSINMSATSKTPKEQTKHDGFVYYREKKIKRTAVISVIVLGCILLISALVILFLNLDWTGRLWFIGIGSGLALTAASVGMAFLFENLINNYKCQTLSVVVPTILLGCILMRCFFSEESFGIVFKILMAFIFAGSIANAVFTHVELEEKFMPLNIFVAVCSAFLFFIWPGNFSWEAWQWIIGVGGGMVLCGAVVVLSWILEEIGPEIHQSLSVMLLLTTFVNFLLLFVIEENYLIIFMCFAVIFGIGSLINAFISFSEDAPVFGIINVILTLLNTAVFLFIIVGSYESLDNTVIKPIKNAISSKNK